MDRIPRIYSKKIVAGVLILLAGVLIWSGFNTLRLKAANIPASFFSTNPFFIINDAQGVNDVPGQKDLTRMGRWEHDGYLDVFWSWDEIQPKSQTFDACALFASTGSGNPNYAICAELINVGDNQNNPSPRLNTAGGFPRFYSCNGTQPLNCGGAVQLTLPASLQMGDLQTLDPTKDLITDTDPFGANVPLGPGDAYPNDTTVRMKILKTDLPGKLINVCTYESASPTSSASDCLANPGGGFLKIVKNTTVGDGTFTFDVNPVPSSNAGSPCNPVVAGCVSYQVQTQNFTGNVGISMGISQNSATVTEEDPAPAFSFTNASCQYENDGPTGAVNTSTRTVSGIGIQASTVTVCTFTNAKQRAHVTVTKVVVNDNGGTASVPNFTLKVGNNVVTSGVSADIADGTYAITESGPSGYTSSFSGDCDVNGNITMGPGQSYSCTITNNDIPPSLTLSKIVSNNYGGSAGPAAFTVSASGPTPISGAGAVTSGSNFVGGTYTLSESGPGGYSAGSWSCTGGSKNGNQITLMAGQTATCTITNSDIQPQLVVKKTVVNNNGGTAVSSNFTMTVTGNSANPSSFPGSPTGTSVYLNAGSYSVAESGPSGYAGLYSADCSGTIAVGEVKTCTVTNNDEAGTFTIIKHAVNSYGGTATANQFTMVVSAGHPSDNNFPGSETGVPILIDAGSFSVTETGGPSGYIASYSGCSGTMTSGGSATCTITNSDIAPQLTVIKKVINTHGGTAQPGAFSGSISGTAGSYMWSGGLTTKTLATGSYSVTENPVTGYTASYSADCNGTISIGQTKTCTVTNQDQTPVLNLIKVVNNVNPYTNDGTATPTAFTILTTGGPTNISGLGFASSGSAFSAGTYTLGESGLAGYTNGGWTCTKNGGTPTAATSISLSIGDTAACTVTNNAVDVPPSISVSKVGDKTNLTQAGGPVTFTVAVKNTSNPLDPFWITSLTDDITGNGNPVDVTTVQAYSATAPYISATTCALTPAGSPIAPGSTYSCQFTVQFPVLTNNSTMTYHDIVRVTGRADDTLSTTNTATGQADAFVTVAVPMQVTDSSLCVFNTGSNPSMRQFDRNFTQNGYYTLGATNPGQYYWNVNVEGTPGTQKSVTLTLPWPFVTQGNMPVHVYDGVFFNPTTQCYIPGHEVASVNNLVQLVTYINQTGNTPLMDVTSPTDWGYPYTAGPSTLTTTSFTPTPTKFVTVTITFTMPATGFAYVNQHLDDGLKGPKVDVNGDGVIDNIPYNKDGNLDATNATNVAQILIPDNVKHTFSVADETGPLGSDAVYNNNWFKKGAVGFYGFVSYNTVYMPGQTVQVWQGSKLVGSAVTDSAGYYTISYKATGKDTYTVTLVNPTSNVLVQSGGGTISTPTTQSVTPKSNGSQEVDFLLMP